MLIYAMETIWNYVFSLLSSCSSFRDSHYGGPAMADQNDTAMSLPPQHFSEDNFSANGLFLKFKLNRNEFKLNRMKVFNIKIYTLCVEKLGLKTFLSISLYQNKMIINVV